MPRNENAVTHGELVTLREYVDMRIESLREEIKTALAAADKAVNKAEASTERRLEGMNEFRSALNDYSRQLMPRLECEAAFRDMKEKVEATIARLNSRDLMPRQESESKHADTSKRLDDVFRQLENVRGRDTGRGDVWGWVVGGVGILIALVTLMLRVPK